MAASEAAVTAVMETLGCAEDAQHPGRHERPVCEVEHHSDEPWFRERRGLRGCEFAARLADAAVDADRASIQAEALREAIREVQWVYDLQCPPRSDWFGKDEFGRGAFCAHRWWSTVLGGALNRLRDRADRIEGKP